MGYYSTLNFEGKAEKINEKALENLNKMLEKSKFEGFEGAEVSFDENGYINIEMADYTNKFQDDEQFVNELAKIIEKGHIIIHFIGEDGITWGYLIKDRKVKQGSFVLVPYDLQKKVEKIILQE